MERLTIRKSDFAVAKRGSDAVSIFQAIDRLADIEDILGDDYDLSRLKELVEAERDGRCVVFPCKVGDIVYTNIAFEMYGYTTSKRTYSAKVVYVGMTDLGIRLVIEFDNGRTMQVTNTDIGYFVFFTKEAAEAVLKGEQDG